MMKLFGKIEDNGIQDKVDECITKSMAIIEQLCPQNEVTKGLINKIDYHSADAPGFSMLTCCQMLWAVTGSYSQSHYIIVDLLETVKKELNSGYFATKDRSFERSFLLMSTTSAPMQFQDPLYIEIINQILNSQESDGYWGTCRGEKPDIRATALNIIALSEGYEYVGNSEKSPFSLIPNSVSKACEWLEKQYEDIGYCKREIQGIDENHIQYTYGVELTAWCTYALIRALECNCYTNHNNKRYNTKKIIQKSVRWLMRLDYDRIASTSEIEQEIYIRDLSKPNEKYFHGYGAGSLEILVLALIVYRESKIYQYISDYDHYLQKAVERLIQNMKPSGEWYDKNTDSYSRAWTVTYALKALTTYQHFLDSKSMFRKQLRQSMKVLVFSFFKMIWRYKIIFVGIILTLFAINHGDIISKYIEFLNSKTCTAIGLICTVLGFIMELKK